MKKIIENDFSRIDLNLMTVFMVLYREASVTRTAAILHLGQPAISGALKRLREMFKDPLFVRSVKGMLPTPRAELLMKNMQPLMEELHAVLFDAPTFSPETANQTFRLGMSDWAEHWLMPMLLPEIMHEAPGVEFHIIATDPYQVRQLLDEENVDIAVSLNKQTTGEMLSESVMSMGFCTLWSEQQIAFNGPLTVNEFIAYEHLLVSYREANRSEIDRQLANHGMQRRVRYVSPHFSSFPLMLMSMPVFATVPEGLARRWQQHFDLQTSEVPVTCQPFTLCLLRHRRRAEDPALNWLMTKLRKIMQT
ncbi:LysR substrate-binding domain-containing protein [Pectobacterium cacticida]|uniref:LysR substrate-binding domain-containing protein n=1 Tax=Pectobacterium cacticida TaxID=69221 RepID=A0ABZ2GEA4_9GAMM|nr:LysR family transcriptional regulator [Pectobacterium cacticida]UYX08645.1 LysR substrate-binding domain-containing protein [Pectobacterium cacticida]